MNKQLPAQFSVYAQPENILFGHPLNMNVRVSQQIQLVEGEIVVLQPYMPAQRMNELLGVMHQQGNYSTEQHDDFALQDEYYPDNDSGYDKQDSKEFQDEDDSWETEENIDEDNFQYDQQEQMGHSQQVQCQIFKNRQQAIADGSNPDQAYFDENEEIDDDL